MKAKKIITGLLAMTMAVSMCASCGPTEQSDGKVEVSIGAWPSNEGPQLDTQNEQKEKFEAENQDITIVPDTWTFDLKSFYPKAEAGLLPNFFLSHFTEFNKLVDGEYIADLTDTLEEMGYMDKFNEAVVDSVSKDGRIYALASSVYMPGITVNMDLFEQAGLLEADGTPKQPQTWEELAEMAKQIKEKTGKPGFVLMTSENCGGWYFTNVAWSYGVKFMEQDADGNWKATFNTPEMVQALQWVSDLKWKYDCLPSEILINQNKQDEMYATGQVGMCIGGPAASRWAKYEMDPKMFGCVAIPAGPVKRVALLGGSLNCVSADSTDEQIKAVLKWCDFAGRGTRFDDEVKANLDDNMQISLDQGQAVGAYSLSLYNNDCEAVAYSRQLSDENYNLRPNAVKLYNDSLTSTDIELQAEEPVCCQDLYGILDNCIQQVLNDQNADLASIIEKANEDFQTNFLNNVDYE